MKIASYYEPLHTPREPWDRQLIEMWRSSWLRHGWDTQVLSLKDAQEHPDFEKFDQAIRKHPTVNGIEYERHCFLRHLAFARSDADLFSDFDIINYGWTPGEMSFGFIWPGNRSIDLHSFMYCHPALYTATTKGFEKLLNLLAHWPTPELINGRPHCSDQTVFLALPMSWTAECADWRPNGEVDIHKHKLVHYGNEWVGGGEEKVRRIREIEQGAGL